MPSQGVTDRDRVGDEISVLGFKVKVFCGQKGDRPNVNWRFIAFSIPKGVNPNSTEVFRTNMNNVMMEETNDDRIIVHLDKKVRPNQAGLTGTGNDEYTFFREFWIPHKRVYKFASTGGHNQRDLYFATMCFDAFGTLPTDNIAYSQVWTEVVYKDI